MTWRFGLSTSNGYAKGCKKKDFQDFLLKQILSLQNNARNIVTYSSCVGLVWVQSYKRSIEIELVRAWRQTYIFQFNCQSGICSLLSTKVIFESFERQLSYFFLRDETKYSIKLNWKKASLFLSTEHVFLRTVMDDLQIVTSEKPKRLPLYVLTSPIVAYNSSSAKEAVYFHHIQMWRRKSMDGEPNCPLLFQQDARLLK